jgi:hypothetical protein
MGRKWGRNGEFQTTKPLKNNNLAPNAVFLKNGEFHFNKELPHI